LQVTVAVFGTTGYRVYSKQFGTTGYRVYSKQFGTTGYRVYSKQFGTGEGDLTKSILS